MRRVLVARARGTPRRAVRVQCTRTREARAADVQAQGGGRLHWDPYCCGREGGDVPPGGSPRNGMGRVIRVCVCVCLCVCLPVCTHACASCACLCMSECGHLRVFICAHDHVV